LRSDGALLTAGAAASRTGWLTSLASSALARRRPRVMRVRISDIPGAEIQRDGDERCGGGALLQRVGEFLPVVDELAHEAEQAAGSAGYRRGAGGRILAQIRGRIGAVG
jgi:hypothetical protein